VVSVFFIYVLCYANKLLLLIAKNFVITWKLKELLTLTR